MPNKPEKIFRTIIEPFKIKSVEPIRITTRTEREGILKAADYDIFRMEGPLSVMIDLLTDSGTNTMSAGSGSASYGAFSARTTKVVG